jgi:hypothetical protein
MPGDYTYGKHDNRSQHERQSLELTQQTLMRVGCET